LYEYGKVKRGGETASIRPLQLLQENKSANWVPQSCSEITKELSMNSQRMAAFVFGFVLLIFAFVNAEEQTDKALMLPAGSRNALLTELTEHYSSDGDSLKRLAAKYLIENMEGHGFVNYELRDTSGQSVDFSIFNYKTYEGLETAFDSLEDKFGFLDFEKKEFIADSAVITPGVLIDHIDWAFTAWQTRPWAAGLSFQQFLEYVLPYRGSNEPLERWREPMYHAYDDIESRMRNPKDPIEAATLINRNLMSWFKFDPRYYYHPVDQGLSEMKATKLGRCEDMTNLTIFAMRANGLAVTSDYTPYWANSGNNHAWNAIVTPEGEVIPFMGAEANPREYKLANKLAKVYRKTYSINRENLAFQVSEGTELPGYLSSKSCTDVTAAYTTVKDMTMTLDASCPDTVKILYLCVFNSGEWKPIQWGKVDGNSVRFIDMGVDVAYLMGYYSNKEIHPLYDPFLLMQDGSIVTLNADTSKSISLQLASTTRVTQDASTDGTNSLKLTPNQKYELFYWNQGWQSVATLRADSSALEFNSVPEGALYWLVAKDSDKEERIFTYEDGRQIWW
jgi:hypothetical protein